MDFFVHLLDTSDFPARWMCGNWSAGHGWLHILSDVGIWSAYFAIPLVLSYFVTRRRDLPFRSIFLLFVAFILLCGMTHLMEAIIFWWPAYRLAGVIKAITAIVSCVTVFALVRIAPSALAMRSPDALERELTTRMEAERQAAAALRESELRYRLVGEAANDVIWDWDLTTNNVVWNGGLQRAFGYTPEQLAPQATWWVERIHPDDRDRVTHEIFAVIKGDTETWTGEYRFRRADGSFVPVFDRGRLVREDGRPIRMVGSMIDLTERMRAEAALRERTAQLDFTLHATGVGMWFNTMPLGKLNWDSRTKELFQVPSSEDPTIELFWSRLHPDDREPTRVAVEVALRDHTLYDIEHRAIHPETGDVRWIRSMGQGSYDETGAPTRFDGINYDITDRKQLEDNLRIVAAELSDANRKKDEFLATLAHELRNPLAPIRNGLQLMKMAEHDAVVVERSRTMMERQLEQMVRLIDDLMDVSRITRGKLELRRQRVTMADIVRSAVEASRPLIEQMGHELIVTQPSQPVVIDADPTRLAQVLSNLLNNAAKYSDREGHIWLTTDLQGSEVVVRVRDTGIGIPPAYLTSVFDLFSQVDRSLEKSQGGLGIGLTLVKRLVEMHGGSIEAQSEGLGLGSEFVVRLRWQRKSGHAQFGKPKIRQIEKFTPHISCR